jgi:hypothetical protein
MQIQYFHSFFAFPRALGPDSASARLAGLAFQPGGGSKKEGSCSGKPEAFRKSGGRAGFPPDLMRPDPGGSRLAGFPGRRYTEKVGE